MSRITNINEHINAWLKANKQWSRAYNIAHVRHQIANVGDPQERAFWQLLLERLEG